MAGKAGKAGKPKKKKDSNGKAKKPAGKTSKKPEGKSKTKKSAKSRCNIDIFNEHAMENAYYTCHNIQDVMKIRGFPWPDAQKKKKKGKKR
jgi:hypothetical protein